MGPSHFTLDANAFYRARFDFTGGVLGALKAFEGSGKFIITDVTISEVQRGLEGEIVKLKKEVGKAAFRDTIGSLIPADVQDRLLAVSEMQAAEDTIKGFVQRTGATVVSTGAVSMDDVMTLYNSRKPPFSDGKKSEFPDAVALLALRSWALQNGATIVAASSDGDWENFARDQEWLDVRKTAQEVIDAMQTAGVDLREEIARFLLAMKEGEWGQLYEKVRDATNEECPYIVRGGNVLEDRWSLRSLEVQTMSLPTVGGVPAYSLVADRPLVVVMINLDVELSYQIEVEMYADENREKYAVSLGSRSFSGSSLIRPLVTLSLRRDGEQLTLADAEVRDAVAMIDLGNTLSRADYWLSRRTGA